MKSIVKVFIFLTVFVVAACQASSTQKESIDSDSTKVDSAFLSIEEDSVISNVEEEESPDAKIVNKFFRNFLFMNDGCLNTKKGVIRLAKAFRKEMKNNIEFAKACARYNTKDENDNSIKNHAVMDSYYTDEGDEGDMWIYEFEYDINLIKPLDDGREKITIRYYITTPVPNIAKETWHPYLAYANFCGTRETDVNFDKSNNTLDLGNFFIGKKDEFPYHISDGYISFIFD